MRFHICSLLLSTFLMVGFACGESAAGNDSDGNFSDITKIKISLSTSLTERSIATENIAYTMNIQNSENGYYLQVRGSMVSNGTGPYGLLLFQDENGNGKPDVGEAYRFENNGGQGYTLDDTTSLIGPVSVTNGALSFSAYNLKVTKTLNSVGELSFTVVCDQAQDIKIGASFFGWTPAQTMNRSGTTFTYTYTVPPGPFGYKFVINNQMIWFPDPNEDAYFPNHWTWYDQNKRNMDWNSAGQYVDEGNTYPVTFNLMEADADGGAAETAAGFHVSYGRVGPFWGINDDAWSKTVHLTNGFATNAVSSGSFTLNLQRGGYYMIRVADSRSTEPYMATYAYLYALPEFSGKSVSIHVMKTNMLTELYSSSGFTEPDYANLSELRGFALVNHARVGANRENFSFFGLQNAALPNYLLQGIAVTQDDQKTGGNPWGIVLKEDYRSRNQQDWGYLGFSFFQEMTDLGATSWDPTLSFMMGVSSGNFFFEVYGIGYLTVIKNMRDELAISEVIIP